MNNRIRILVPIRGPELDDLNDNYERLLKEIPSFSDNPNLLFLLDEFEEIYRRIIDIKLNIISSSKFDNNEDPEIKVLSKKYKVLHTEWISEFLELKINFKDRIGEFSEIVSNHILNKLSLLIHLSFNVKIDFLGGLIFDEEKKKRLLGRTEILMSTVDMAYEHTLKLKWPKIPEPTFTQTINWFIQSNLHFDGISKTKGQLAINAFSYNFSNLKDKETSQLFWTMIGIESLLAEGSSNIINQIKVKSTILLGHPKDFKKKLDKLYNYRSRLVHGNISFPAKFSSDFENFEVEYWDYSQFGLSILLALIKELIVRGKNEFLFDYKLIE